MFNSTVFAFFAEKIEKIGFWYLYSGKSVVYCSAEKSEYGGFSQ
jgi:hypothetical protein